MPSFAEIIVIDNVSSSLAPLADDAWVDDVLMAGALVLKGKIDDYPPSKSRPGRMSLRTRRPMGYYKRGTGWMEPVVKDGRAVRYFNRRATSETFGRKWTAEKRRRGEVAVGNNTSYGPWVKSKVRIGGKGPQSRLLRAHGWTTIEQDVAREERNIVARVQREMDRKFK